MAVLYDTYCHHGGIDVVSGIVGGTTSNVEVVGGVCNRLYSKSKQCNSTYNYVCCIICTYICVSKTPLYMYNAG